MNLRQRIDLLDRLGDYITSGEPAWIQAKEEACAYNNWFIPGFVDLACEGIARNFLRDDLLEDWIGRYRSDGPGAPAPARTPKTVGLVMAGNIPLVGFHDFLCVFLSGHNARIKVSSKDAVLLPHLVSRLETWAPGLMGQTVFADRLKDCDAYIATGSNNTSRYFDYYFGKYPHIIRRNRTSIAVLTGHESPRELQLLADDIQQYFGLGCRNVTKIYVPEGYDFVPLLEALRRYNYFFDHSKYRANYDYQLAIYLMNNQLYMTNGSIVLVENRALFSPIGTLYYEFYASPPKQLPEVQCLVGDGGIPFGMAQSPGLSDYADGVDTMAFLRGF